METETIGIDDDVYDEQIGIETHGEESMEDTVGTSSEIETEGGECPEGNEIATGRESSVHEGGEPHSRDDEGIEDVESTHKKYSRLGAEGSHSILPCVARSVHGSQSTAGEEGGDLEVACKGARYSRCDHKHWTDSEVAGLHEG